MSSLLRASRCLPVTAGSILLAGVLVALVVSGGATKSLRAAPSKTDRIADNLRQLDRALQQRAADRRPLDAVVTRDDVARYLRQPPVEEGCVRPVAGELYVLKMPPDRPEVVLTRAVEGRPRGTIFRLLTNATLLAVLPRQEPPGSILRIDSRYSQEIRFEALGVRVPLGSNAFVRADTLVGDTPAQVERLFRELGLARTNVSYSDSAEYGGEVHLRFGDGKECSFLWVRPDKDSRITQSRLEHEKYHAAYHLAPDAVHTLSTRAGELGFRLHLCDHDDEFGATLIELLSLHLGGIALENLRGSELVEKALRVLRHSKAVPNKRGAGDGGIPSQLHTGRSWPAAPEPRC